MLISILSQTPVPVRGRVRDRSRFQLQSEESQWSASLSQNSFQPLDFEQRSKTANEDDFADAEDEPEIVTAGNEDNVSLKTLLINL
jgi:hypothetical protein